MEQEYQKLQDSLISIAVEQFRFKRIYEKVLSKLEYDDQKKYMSQFSWFDKKVTKALEEAGLSVYNPEGEQYDPGVAAAPLNIDDFEPDDLLFVKQTVEPIILKDGVLLRSGTVLLGRIEE